MHGEGGGFLAPIIGQIADDFGRAGLRVPALELREIFAACVREARDEVFDRDGLAVVAIEIEIHSGAKLLAAQNGLDHANQLGAFFVNSRRIEIVDLDVALRPNRMRQGSLILGKLQRLQLPNIGDALDGSATLIG